MQHSSKWKPIKKLHLTKELFKNKTSTQSHLSEKGLLARTTVNLTGITTKILLKYISTMLGLKKNWSRLREVANQTFISGFI